MQISFLHDNTQCLATGRQLKYACMHSCIKSLHQTSARGVLLKTGVKNLLIAGSLVLRRVKVYNTTSVSNNTVSIVMLIGI